MSEIQFSNGSAIENTFTDETQPCLISEAYATLRFLKNEQGNLIDEVNAVESEKLPKGQSYELPEDSDMVQYYEFLRNITLEGESLGSLQRVVTDFRGDEYFANQNLGAAMDFKPANDTEQKIADNLFSERNNRDKATTKHWEQAMVPLDGQKEEMPLYVASEERFDGGLQTFEEAEEMWESFLDSIPTKTSSDHAEEIRSEDDESDEQDDEDDSDRLSVNDPTRIKGVGSATIETLREGGFEVVPSDVDKIEVEPFGFENDEPEETQVGMPSPDKIMELQENGWTKEEIQDFYGE